MVNSSIVYVITVLMGLPNSVTMVLAVTFACTIAAFPVLAPLTRAVGVIRALRWTLGAATVIVPLIGAIGLRGLPFNPPAQGYVVVVLAALPLAGLLVLPNALLADGTCIAFSIVSTRGRETPAAPSICSAAIIRRRPT